MLIPKKVLATVSNILADAFSHPQINDVFASAGAPGDPPGGNKNVKCRNWLRRINEEMPDRALEVFGNLAAELIEMEHVDPSFDATEFEQLRDRFRTSLAGSGLEYVDGGTIRKLGNSGDEMAGETIDPSKVFVIHGRNDAARKATFDFLRALGLKPIEWTQAIQGTWKPSPYVGDVLDHAFSVAGALVVVLTGDDLAQLRPELQKDDDLPYERTATPQARANVLFEAGMAYGAHRDQTLFVQFGDIRPFSDIAGRHLLRLTDDPERRKDFVDRLKNAGCSVDDSGSDWLSAGDFRAALETAAYEAPSSVGGEAIEAPQLEPNAVTILELLTEHRYLTEIMRLAVLDSVEAKHHIGLLQNAGFIYESLSLFEPTTYSLTTAGASFLYEQRKKWKRRSGSVSDAFSAGWRASSHALLGARREG